MLHLRVVAGTGAIVLALAGCSGVTDVPRDAGVLTTDAPSYVAAQVSPGQPDYQFTVVATVRNTTSATLTFPSCGSGKIALYQVRIVSADDSAKSAYDGPWICTGGGNSIVLASGATRVDTIVVRGPTGFDDATGKWDGSLEGTFQLNYYGAISNRSIALHSNTFTVQLGSNP